MGLLDKAKKVAEQAKQLAEQAKDLAEDKREELRSQPASTTPSGPSGTDKFGTPYVPGTFGRAGWRERGLVDPAAVLPIDARDRAGIPRSTKSELIEEPYGMGRRWSSGDRSAALLYQLYPEHQSWQAPPSGALPDGRSLFFLGEGEHRVVLELKGLGPGEQSSLADAVSAQLG
jgi:hypothetical protein